MNTVGERLNRLDGSGVCNGIRVGSMTGRSLGLDVGRSVARVTMTGARLVGGTKGSEVVFSVASSVGFAVSGGATPRTRNDM